MSLTLVDGYIVVVAKILVGSGNNIGFRHIFKIVVFSYLVGPFNAVYKCVYIVVGAARVAGESFLLLKLEVGGHSLDKVLAEVAVAKFCHLLKQDVFCFVEGLAGFWHCNHHVCASVGHIHHISTGI